jgi:hypothetical protein
MSKKDLALLLYDFMTKEIAAGKTGVSNRTENVDKEGMQIKFTLYGTDGENLVFIIDNDEIKIPKEPKEEESE